ncbi:MAG TPA: hypothetical protein VHT25_12885 [Solirubrobacteraceae bacterium]|jgi:fatty acid desaturase|nr:hypothetical protein [Solirubrobacteraceae bacterium]
MAYEQQAMRGGRVKRAAMAAATAFLAINLWTGAPLIALWVGSKTSGSTVLSMQAVFVVVVVLAMLVFVMVMALAWLNESYNSLTGRPPGERRLRWLRSMNTQGQDDFERTGVSALEQIVMASVYIAVIALLVWFFVFARSPLPG